MTASRPSRGTVSVLALTMLGAILLACGCDGDRAYDEGYREGYAEGRAAGILKGESRGADDGSSEGESSAAGEVREGGLALASLGPAVWSFLAGIGIGLLIQYIILLDAKDKGRVPSLVQTGLVPGMTSTFSYKLLERRWRLMARLDDWLTRVARQRNARLHEIRTVRAVVAARINAASDLEDLVARKYVALAGKELNRIVSEAENERRSPPPSPDGDGAPAEPSTSD